MEDDYGQVSLLGYTSRILKELISRRPDTVNNVAFDYYTQFSAFVNEEPSLWNPPRSASELVRPSGELVTIVLEQRKGDQYRYVKIG